MQSAQAVARTLVEALVKKHISQKVANHHFAGVGQKVPTDVRIETVTLTANLVF